MTEKPSCFYAGLLENVLRDAASMSSKFLSIDVERDVAHALKRYNAEGLAFLHTRLKEISTALLHVLEFGQLPALPSFKKISGTPIPVFLQDYWLAVCNKDGSRAQSVNGVAVASLYQIGSMFSKLELPYPDRVVDQFINAFVDTDAKVGYKSSPKTRELLSSASNVLHFCVQGLDLSSVRPKHGPGAVSTGERQEKKWDFSRLYLDLDEYYSYFEYFTVGDRHMLDNLDKILKLEVKLEADSKFVLVPKTATTPRGIVTQPNELMFIQEGQMTRMVHHLERNFVTQGQVNFTHQSINRELALTSSHLRNGATLDLSEASDRLSLQLVKELFINHDELLRHMLASRASHVILPDGRRIKLRKFAAMGSALCFPVEALCFFVICVAAITLRRRVPWNEVSHLVFVYGDDIIVPSDDYECVIEALELVGLRVNRLKSFKEGNFRESCGMHAFYGQDITPVKIRKVFPTKNSDGSALESYISYAHAFEVKSYHRSAEFIYSRIESLLRAKLPYGSSDSGWICRLCDDPSLARILNIHRGIRWRWSKTYQRAEYYVPYLTVGYRASNYVDGWHRLHKAVVAPDRHGDPSQVVVPRSTKIKRGWRP